MTGEPYKLSYMPRERKRPWTLGAWVFVVLWHRLFTILAALSLLLFVAVVALWVSSYFLEPAFHFTRSEYRWRVAARAGIIVLDNMPQVRAIENVPGYDPPTPPAFVGHSVPLLLLAAIFGLCPALRMRAHVSALDRMRNGLCPACGYDVRATPDRCPECGSRPAKAST